MEGARIRDTEGHPAVQLRRHRPRCVKQDKRRGCRPRSAVDPRELRAASTAFQARRAGRSRTTVDMADVLVALEMQRLQRQTTILSGCLGTPPGSRSSFGSLHSVSSTSTSSSGGGITRMGTEGGALLPPPPPPYDFQHRKAVIASISPQSTVAPPPGFASPTIIRRNDLVERFPTPPADGCLLVPQPQREPMRSASSDVTYLSDREMRELMELAGPDVRTERLTVLSSLRTLSGVAAHADDDDEESSFDGVSTRQLEEMRLLHVQQRILMVEQAQLEHLSDPSAAHDLPPPPEFDEIQRTFEDHLPGYLPAPQAFADDDDEIDEDDDDVLANLMSGV